MVSDEPPPDGTAETQDKSGADGLNNILSGLLSSFGLGAVNPPSQDAPQPVEHTPPERKRYAGVGISFARSQDDSLLVFDLTPGGGAEATGLLQPGDRLVEIDGVNVDKRPLPYVSGLLLGVEGTNVSIGFARPGQDRLVQVSIQRIISPVLPLDTPTPPPAPMADLGNHTHRQSIKEIATSFGSSLLLHGAVMMASIQMANEPTDEIRSILMSGVNVNAEDADGCTAIFYASGSPATMSLLLQHGARARTSNSLGNTPLHYAAAADSPGACQLLVQFGAEVNAVNAMGLTAKDLATAVRKTAALEYLKSVVVLDADGRTQAGLDQSLIMVISEEGPSSDGLRVYTLLQQGAGPNATDAATGLRALHLAAIRDAREAARFLLIAGAGSSMLTVDGPRLSPLACAVIARAPNQTYVRTRQPMASHGTAAGEHYEHHQAHGWPRPPGGDEGSGWIDKRNTVPGTAQELCRADSDLSAELFLDGGVTTALHLAVVNDDLRMVEVLVGAGADTEQLDSCGQTAEQVAMGGLFNLEPDKPRIAQVLRRRSPALLAAVQRRRLQFHPAYPAVKAPVAQADLDEVLGKALQRADLWTAAQLLSAGANANSELEPAADEAGADSPLARAAAGGSARAAELLLGRWGADPDALGRRSGEAAIHFAARFGRANVVAVLLAHKAKVDLTTGATVQASRTPRDPLARPMAVGAEREEHPDAWLATLHGEERKREVRRSRPGTTALMLAAENDDPYIVRALLAAGANVTLKAPDGKTAAEMVVQKATSRSLLVRELLDGARPAAAK